MNSRRGNLPLGYVSKAEFTSTNGSKIGPCKSNISAKCFEVADNLKGDLARNFFYLSMAYRDKWTCCDDVGVNKWYLKQWMENDLRAWHAGDPVDALEKERNEKIYTNWQKNRNPFVDHPEWLSQIKTFGDSTDAQMKRSRSPSSSSLEPASKKARN